METNGEDKAMKLRYAIEARINALRHRAEGAQLDAIPRAQIEVLEQVLQSAESGEVPAGKCQCYLCTGEPEVWRRFTRDREL